MNKKILAVTALAALVAGGCKDVERSSRAMGPQVVETEFGTMPDGKGVIKQYRVFGKGGMVVDMLDYGARIRAIWVPDRSGKMADVTFGYRTAAEYERYSPTVNAFVGRYANRIADGKFTLDGKEYTLPLNNDPQGVPCCLHGGDGFSSRLWESRAIRGGDDVGVEFRLRSPDGDQGFPGNLDVTVRYWIRPDNTWRAEYEAQTDAPTVVNFTNHIYFNLHGDDRGDTLDHDLWISADRTTPVRPGLIPTGEFAPVEGTPFDFTSPRKVGERCRDFADAQIAIPSGYDHNWVLRGQSGRLTKSVFLHEAGSGRYVEIWTTEPGLQIWGGQELDKFGLDRYGRTRRPYSGIALETQHYPDSPNQPGFPTTVLRPGEKFTSVTEYRFGVIP